MQKDVIVENRELLEDQAAAAAVVDAEQSNTVAAQVAADGGILPTDAPFSHSIGEFAQAPAPTTTDTTTTTPAPVAEETTTMSPWAIGGIALVGVAAIAAAASSGGDDSPSPAPAPQPPAPPPPEPAPAPAPANVAPTSADKAVVTEADGTTKLAAADFKFTDANTADALTTVKIGAITATPITNVAGAALQYDAATGHGYELVTGPVAWEAARDAAIAKGGHLAILDTSTEMAWVNQQYVLAVQGTGADGTWIGASQAADAATLSSGWTWLNGTALDASAASLLWNNVAPNAEPNDADGAENHAEDFAAVFDGTGPNDTHLIYDAGPGGATGTQAAYLIEYDTAQTPLTLNGAAVAAGQTLAVADLANLSWNSLFVNPDSSVKFAVGDKAGAYSTPENTLTFGPAPPVSTDAGASQSISTLIEDQHMSALA